MYTVSFIYVIRPGWLFCTLQIADRHPYIVEVAGQGEGIHKRGSGYANIRIHPILTVTVGRANEFFHGENSPLSRAIDTLQRLLFVRPVQGNLTIQPICEEYASGLNKGKCMAPLPSQDNYKCGRFGAIPHQYIGTREVCITSNSLCTMEGPTVLDCLMLITCCLCQCLR